MDMDRGIKEGCAFFNLIEESILNKLKERKGFMQSTPKIRDKNFAAAAVAIIVAVLGTELIV